MRTAILALIFAIPVSLTADLISMAVGAPDEALVPCVEPVKAVPQILPPMPKSKERVKRPPRHKMRAA